MTSLDCSLQQEDYELKNGAECPEERYKTRLFLAGIKSCNISRLAYREELEKGQISPQNGVCLSLQKEVGSYD